MADQPKRKTVSQRGTRNDSRKNGKAAKSGGPRNKGYRPSELEKALWGQGAMRRISRPAPEKARTPLLGG